MELRHIDIANLTVSAANMRGRGKPNVADLLPSVRARGVLVPLIVRQNACPERAEGATAETFEIVAGKRRYHAALAVTEEARAGGEAAADPLPCAIMEAGDDAAALEASLIENIARLDPDEVTRWESFTRLVREGRTPEQIALTFGLTDRQVKRTLALGNLLPRIRQLYRHEQIDAATVRHLTLADKARQRAWLALWDSEDGYCPTGHSLKAWLFGGSSIPTKAALFNLTQYKGEIVTDLFGEDSYFTSVESFWAAQMEAVEARAAAYREAGWTEVVILSTGEAFRTWEHEHCPKRKGGKVFIAVSPRGDASIHEGFISLKEARRRAKGESGADAKPVRPEVSAPLASYIDLHRHAAVRAALAGQPSVALRVMVAHAICGSALWNVRVEPQRGQSDAITESVESSAAEAAFDTRRRAVLDALGFDAEAATVSHRYDGEHGLAGLAAQLMRMADSDVLDILAIVMGETLEPGTPLIELLGREMAVDMAQVFVPDDTLLDLIRDREVMDAVLADVAGKSVASANAKATAKVKRGIVRDCLNGTNGRGKVENWVPKWMGFPPAAYTARGGVPTVSRAAQIAALTSDEPEVELEGETEIAADDAADELADAA